MKMHPLGKTLSQEATEVPEPIRQVARKEKRRGLEMKPERIKAIMKAANLSCNQLACLVGVPKRTMESYIQGRRNMPESIVISILEVGVRHGIQS